MVINNFLKVCSVLPALLVMPAMATDISGTEEMSGVSIDSGTDRVYVVLPDANFTLTGANINNVVVSDAGAVIHAEGLSAGQNTSITVKNSYFSGNVSNGVGGVIKTNPGDTDGGRKTMLTIDNTTFEDNHALYDGGAIGNYSGLKITNSIFDGNTAQLAKNSETGAWDVAIEDAQPVGGGALALGAVSATEVASISGTTFKNNVSGKNGGAIATRLGAHANNSTAILDIAATFENNNAIENGGAIYNTFYTDNGLGKGDGVTVAGEFTGNTAGLNGGAIYNDGAVDNKGAGNPGGVMTINNAEFEKNSAGSMGGALFNSQGGTLNVSGSSFNKNVATEWYGGAISSYGALDVVNSYFSSNDANVFGGAIHSGYNNAGVGMGTAKISGSQFRGNTAGSGGGAVANYGSMEINIKSSLFAGNRVTGTVAADGWNNHNLSTSVDGGGALFLGSASTTTLESTIFENNWSTVAGGAIATRADWKLANGNGINTSDNAPDDHDSGTDILMPNTVATLGIKKAYFEDNVAGTFGGALYNTFQNVTIEDAIFEENSAYGLGGAIYNDMNGKISLSGTNLFVENSDSFQFEEKNDKKIVAHSVGNDIYNRGEIVIAGGQTTIGSGIAGDGKLTVADGATLNMGTTTIVQDVLNLDGTINADIIRNGRDGGTPVFAKLLAKTISGAGTLNLNISSAGTYKIFNDGVTFANVTFGDIYDGRVDGDSVVVATKSVEDIASQNNLTQGAATLVSALANSDNASVAPISLQVQRELAASNSEYVESELAKANPDTAPLAQSVATSIQNQVANLTAGRMDGAIMGRSGGDAPRPEYGFWAQGMFNKSKMNDQFHGYTRGVAFGLDALINKKYTLGIGGAFSNSDVHTNNDRTTEIESNSVFLYAQYKPTRWFINGVVNYNMSNYDESTTMFGMPLRSEYDVDAFGAQVMTGYSFATGITPEIGARYLHVSQDAYNNGIVPVDANDTDYATAVAGVKYAFTIDTDTRWRWTPQMRAAMTYDFVSDESVATVTMPGASAYVVDAGRLSRLGGEFGLGLGVSFAGLELSANYEIDLHEDFIAQSGIIKFRHAF